MPKIELRFNTKKRKYVKKSNNLIHRDVYNTGTWRKLRQYYLSYNPLCEDCEKNGKLSLAIDVHHKTPISDGDNINERKVLGFNINNLKALCKECHKKYKR